MAAILFSTQYVNNFSGHARWNSSDKRLWISNEIQWYYINNMFLLLSSLDVKRNWSDDKLQMSNEIEKVTEVYI